MSPSIRPRPDKKKKPVKPHRYKHEGNAPDKVKKYMCPIHDRWHILTKKQISGEHPVKCTDHDVVVDFRFIDRIMARS